MPPVGYTNGTVYPLTISVTNTIQTPAAPFGLRDGFDLSTTAGTFTAVSGTTSTGPEIFHNTPKPPVSGTSSWTFNWTAPASGSANITFNVAGNATNGDGTNGNGDGSDKWNQTSTTIYKAGTALTVTASSGSILCNGNTTIITASAFGPTAPYQYKLNAGGFQTANTFSGILAGTYTITVKDANALTASTTLTITQPALLTAGASATPVLCNGGTSAITASASGGTGTYTYKLNAGTFQSSAVFNSNLAGTYTISVRDGNACTKTTLLTITQPSALSYTSVTPFPPLCFGGNGTLTVTGSGGTGTKTYTINPLGPQSNTTGSFSGLTAQTYTITMTDANTCILTTASTITAPANFVFTAPTINPPLCNGGVGTVSISATGGTGTKTYTINPSGPQSNTISSFSGLIAQTYTITVSDANGCT